MRILAALLLLAAASPLAAQADAPAAGSPPAGVASYAGRWRLDTTQSRDLPPFYANVREHLLDIAQDDSSLTVDVALVHDGDTSRLRFPYDLRHPVKTTTQVGSPRGPMDVPTTLTATPRTDGGLEIDIARAITLGERVLRPRDHERWQLSADGTQLIVDREAEMPAPGGLKTFRTHYVFVRG